MQMTECSRNSPGLRLPEGMQIGYGQPIANVVEGIELGQGTHFLLARNGRGKTTLLKTISGLLPAVSGKFEVAGRCKFIADDLSFDRELPAAHVFRAFLPKSRWAEAKTFAEELELDTKKPFGKRSFGNRKKVGLVVSECAIDDGEIVFYDEPFTGLDTPTREALLARWERTEGSVLRLVSCHPDLDEMAMPSAVLITDGNICRPGDGRRTWSDLKKHLN